MSNNENIENEEKKVIINSSDINKFKEMLNSFSINLKNVNNQFEEISECKKKKFNKFLIIDFQLKFVNKLKNDLNNEIKFSE
jgi:hypothetical protein